MSEDLSGALDDLLANPAAYAPPRAREAAWRPGVSWEGEEGTVTTGALPADGHPDWDEVLRVWDLDPEKFAVVEPVLFNAWDAAVGDGQVQRMRQWKGKVVRRRGPAAVDLDALVALVESDPPFEPPPLAEGVFAAVLGDWQTGKPEGGGSPVLVHKVLTMIGQVEHRVLELRALGRPLGELLVLWPGDSVEGCLGHYPMQEFGVDLDRRAQETLVRRLLLKALRRWARLFGAVRVVAVGGNHGENRRRGKAWTTFADNADLAVVEQVCDVLAEHPGYAHVQFCFAPDSLTVTVPAAGYVVGVHHGHIAGAGATPEAKIRRHFEAMAGGRQPLGDADVLVTGHFHHERIVDWGSTVWVQGAALDGGSEWFRLRTGYTSAPGTTTFAIYPGVRLADHQLLRA
ncbi:MAG: hypothetical protein ACOYY2_13065 [Actinomycetota bacterium]